MTFYNQYIGDLLPVANLHHLDHWPICNETGQVVGVAKNNDLVVVLGYTAPERAYSSNLSLSEGTVKVLTTQGEIGYMPAKYIDYPPATRKQT